MEGHYCRKLATSVWRAGLGLLWGNGMVFEGELIGKIVRGLTHLLGGPLMLACMGGAMGVVRSFCLPKNALLSRQVIMFISLETNIS